MDIYDLQRNLQQLSVGGRRPVVVVRPMLGDNDVEIEVTFVARGLAQAKALLDASTRFALLGDRFLSQQ